jgi:hypothetical protein
MTEYLIYRNIQRARAAYEKAQKAVSKSNSEKKEELKKKANHGLLGCSARLSGIVRHDLPKEVLEKELAELHKQLQEAVQMINEL